MLRPVSLLPALVAGAVTLGVVSLVPGTAVAAPPDPLDGTGRTGAHSGAHSDPHTDPQTGAHTDREPQVSRFAARSAPAADDQALDVTIESLTPSYLPERGVIRISGSVTNRTEETWSAVNVYPFVGSTPITSSQALATERDREPTEFVGERITEVGSFDDVDSLGPGETVTYSIRLRSRLLGLSEPGAYWFGVHALGETATIGRDLVADGRARTFLPVVPERLEATVDTAIVVPVRRDIRHTASGRIAGVRGWARDLDTGGALDSLVDLGASSGSLPITWLVDPAVPEAVRRLTTGNQPRSLADTVPPAPVGEGEGDENGQSPSPGPEESGQPSPDDGGTAGPGQEEVPQNAATEPGLAWLDRLREAVEGDQVLALPFGDVDVSASLERDPSVYERARLRSGGQLEPWDVATDHAVNAPSGYVDPDILGGINRRDTLLVSDEMLGGPDAPAVVRVAGRRMVATSSVSAGGPDPGHRLAVVPLRQQILAEAAVRALEPRPRPLVVVVPPDWNPPSVAAFFDGLEAPWVGLTDLAGLDSQRGGQLDRARLGYPDRQTRRELDAANFAAAQALVQAGDTLQNVLLRNDRIGAVVADEALTGLSYAARSHPNASRVEADRSRRWIARKLRSVTIDAPRAVTLSSASGRFAATLTNDLEHPVRVRVRAITDEPMQIEGPDLIELAAGSSTSVLLNASTDRLGVSNVRLLVTDENGTPLGSTDSLPIRSAQVSRVIWLILGTGVALLFGAIVVRLVRRVRRARAAA